MKHLLFLMHSLRFGGAERQTVDLISRLDPSRFSASICCFGSEGGQELAVVAPSLRRITRLGKKGRFDLGLFRRLAAVLAEERPDVVVCVNHYPLPFVHCLRWLAGGRYAVVPVMHSTTFPDRYSEYLMKLIFGPLASRSDAVVFVCGTQRDHWTGNYRIDSRKAVVIANGVDVAQYRPRFSPGERAAFRNMLGFDTESFVICNCSAFRPEKRQTDLIAAAKVLRGRGADVRVLLVGDGGERCRIVRCIDDMGMRASVCLAGYQSDVRPYLECADAVVNCSRAESLSMAILEAMAMGRALVCTDVGGTGEQVAEQVNGFLYEPGDVQALADRIALLFEPGLRARFGAASREMAESTFSLHAMVSGYQQLFERMP